DEPLRRYDRPRVGRRRGHDVHAPSAGRAERDGRARHAASRRLRRAGFTSGGPGVYASATRPRGGAMRAAVMEGIRQPLVVRDVPDPTPPANGVVLRVEANGICRSDWHLWTGDWSWFGLALALPHVLGHEFCGVIEEVGPEVTRWRRGARVLVPFSQGE